MPGKIYTNLKISANLFRRSAFTLSYRILIKLNQATLAKHRGPHLKGLIRRRKYRIYFPRCIQRAAADRRTDASVPEKAGMFSATDAVIFSHCRLVSAYYRRSTSASDAVLHNMFEAKDGRCSGIRFGNSSLHGGSARETVEEGAGRLPLLKGPFEPKKVRMTF